MKCRHCQSEWNVAKDMALSFTNCPFCGKPLSEAPRKLETMEDVLRAILAEQGRDAMKNGKLVLSMYKDLAPQQKRNQKMLAYFVEAGGPTTLFAALQSGPADRKTSLQRVVHKMVNDLIVEEKAARSVCSLYWQILSGDAPETADPVPPPSPAQTGKTPPKKPAATAPAPQKPASTPPAPKPADDDWKQQLLSMVDWEMEARDQQSGEKPQADENDPVSALNAVLDAQTQPAPEKPETHEDDPVDALNALLDANA